MLDADSRSDTIPAMDIRCKNVDVGHEATIGRISDDTVFYLMSRGISEEEARTMVVNTLVVLEIFYLFNIRYLHMTSFTLAGARGTPAVLWAVGVVVVAQLAFTYAPFMQRLFDTRPVALVDGLLVIAIGVLLMLVLETEKALMRRLGWFEELGGTPTRGRQA